MRPQHRYGFTLLEMSIVLLLIATIMGGGAIMFAASVQQNQEKDTRAKLATIQKALLDYRRAFNRIPCPANVEIATTATSFGVNFGVEAALTGGNCVGGTPAANFTSGDIHEGMVPVKTLQLPDDFAFDGWGRRIMYAVDEDFAASNAFTTVSITDNTSRITIDDASGNPRTEKAIYVLMSYGRNSHGAYPRTVTSSTRISSGSTNTDELENCDCTDAGVSGTYDAVYVQKLPTQDTTSFANYFDDIVVFAERKDLWMPNE